MAKSFSIIPGIIHSPFPPPTAIEIRLNTKSGSIPSGSTLSLTGSAYDHFNRPIAAPLVWSSSNTAVATVSVSGSVTFVGKGITVISTTVVATRATTFVTFTSI